MPSEREIWTRRKIFCKMESRIERAPLWVCSLGGQPESLSRCAGCSVYHLPSTVHPIVNLKNRNCARSWSACRRLLVSVVPQGYSSAKLNNFCRVHSPGEPGRSVIRRSRRTAGKASHRQDRRANSCITFFYIPMKNPHRFLYIRPRFPKPLGNKFPLPYVLALFLFSVIT
jgi:hypothetical protein